MGLVVLGVNEGLVVIAWQFLEAFAHEARKEKLFFDPDGDGLTETSEACRSEGDVRFEKTLELEERFFVEDDVVDMRHVDALLVEAVLDGVDREGGVVFFSCEAFFLGGSRNLAVTDESSGRVVVKSGYSENVHGRRRLWKLSSGRWESVLSGAWD